LVDEHGWNNDPFGFFNNRAGNGLYPEEWPKVMHDELKRLSGLWENR